MCIVDQSIDFQFDELKRILSYCQDYVPYYGKLFSEYEFNPKIQSFNDINKFILKFIK